MDTKDLKSILANGIQKTEYTTRGGTKVKLRAMLMKEFKQLMLAMNSDDAADQFQAVKFMIENCVLTEGYDPMKVPVNELEEIYLEIYKLSKGNRKIPIYWICENQVEDSEGTEHTCGNRMRHVVDLDKVYFDDVKSDPYITISPDLSMKMRYPTILEDEYHDMETDEGVINATMNCIDELITSDGVFRVGVDIEPEQILEIAEEYLSLETIESMMDYIVKMPRMKYSIAMKCDKCGADHPIELVGLADFFE